MRTQELAARSYRAQAEAVTLLSELEGGEQLAGLTYASALKDPLMNTARQNVLIATLARVVAEQDARLSELEARLAETPAS